MKILLVIPRYMLTNTKNYEYSFPLGLGYISSVIKQAGHEIDCLNLNHFNGDVEHLINEKLDRKKYDIVATGHLGIGYAIIEKILNTVRNHSSKPKTVLGGALVTSEPKLMFESLKPDIAVFGEGEITIVELLDYLEKKKDLKEVKGIIYWNNGKAVFTKPREPIEDLDSIAFPDFEGLGFEEQLGNMNCAYSFDYPRAYPILCSRGCPFHCTFCYHCLGIKYRTRSLDNVMKELRENVKKYKINMINIHDDLFSVNKERLYEFCKEIKKLFKEIPWKCEWSCQLSVQNVDREMLSTVKDAKCTAISWGFESYSPTVLKSMKKPITPEQIDKAIKLSMEFKINIMGNFIFGDVAETKETAKETLDYWKKNCKGQVKLYFIQPYPGSEIYNHCIEKGIIKDKLDFIKNRINHLTWLNMTNKMNNEEILQLKKEIIEARRKYYKYIMPIRIKSDKKTKKRYKFLVKCPFCREKVEYKNCNIQNKFYFNHQVYCRKCGMSFYVISRIYKFTVDYYQELDFFRRNFLLIRDNFLKKRI
ncbi:MAG: radical SAM protein [Nanoarchaeota archaeon]|nr:radical SAM protein [Nanoarchaeota archaeon]